jgi:hypothetical protein
VSHDVWVTMHINYWFDVKIRIINYSFSNMTLKILIRIWFEW